MTTTAPAESTTSVAQRVATWGLLLWGVLHVVGGAVLLGSSFGSAEDAMRAYASGLDAPTATGAGAEAITGLVGFHGWNIAAAGVAVTVLAWRGRRRGKAALPAPLLIALVADLGLAAFLLVPGVMAPADGAPGIVLFLVGLGGALGAGWRPGANAAA